MDKLRQLSRTEVPFDPGPESLPPAPGFQHNPHDRIPIPRERAMGYFFSYADGKGPDFDIPGSAMIDVREALRIAVTEAGPACPVQMHKFESNDRWHVSPEEAQAIADLLGGRKAELLDSDYRCYVDGVSDGLVGELRALGEFSGRAATRGGFYVS